ncbi:hypothetical protein Btru_043822 [Bulinus truncatus]|nr:hypothetical protein Btru_043822 [Bulinus truncatus]
MHTDGQQLSQEKRKMICNAEIFFFAILLNTQLVKTALVIEVQPSRIQPGLTKDLIVNCSITDNKIPQMLKILSLILSRETPDVDDYEELVVLKYNRFNNSTVTDSKLPDGSSSINGASYISLTWPHPTYRDASKYKCEAQGISTLFSKLTATAYASVISDEPDIKALVQEIYELRKETYQTREYLEELKDKYGHLNNIFINSVTALQNQRDISKEFLFYASAPYKGKRYYLSKQQVTFQLGIAQSTCALYGGYLAEIDNSEEFLFVRNFLNNFTIAMSVFVGLTDLGHEGVWSSIHSKHDPIFVPWYTGEPNNGLGYDCAYMERSYEWRYADLPCYHIDTSSSTPRYLCEMEEEAK